VTQGEDFKLQGSARADRRGQGLERNARWPR